jgi:hypothetical protein
MVEEYQPRPIVVKQVDHNALVGSNKGDHRQPALAADVTAFAKNSPSPRQSAGQFKGSKFEIQPPFVSTANAEETGS